MMVIDEVRAMLKDYFDVLQSQDLAKFDKVFHPGSVLYSAQNGVVVVRPIDEYRNIVKGRESPQSRGFARMDEILMIDVMSPEMVLVKVRLQLFDHIMVDYLNLMKIDNQWRIVSKHFHQEKTIT